MKAGFIGLGALGKAMAQRLIVEGVDLTVWNRTPEKALGLGVPIAETPAGLMRDNEIVFISVFDSSAVENILTGMDGLLLSDCHNKVLVDMTTNHYQAVGGFSRAVREKGGFYVECPVLGSVIPAGQGTLTLLVGGEKEAIERVVPFLEKLALHLFYFDEEGLATKMKLVNNLVLGSFVATLAEALAHGEEAGLSKATVLEILEAGAGKSTVLEAKKEKFIRENWRPSHFSVATIHKDLLYLEDLLKISTRQSEILPVIKNMFSQAMAENPSLDLSSVYRTFKKRGG
jgi:3-hydroxyisobutyrate dehydrogenase